MSSFYSIAFIVNLKMRHKTRAWCGVTLIETSRQQKRVPEMKRSIAHALLYWWELIPFYQRISRIFFKICFWRSSSPVWGPSRHILEILLARRHTLVAQNRRVSVRLHHWWVIYSKCAIREMYAANKWKP